MKIEIPNLETASKEDLDKLGEDLLNLYKLIQNMYWYKSFRIFNKPSSDKYIDMARELYKELPDKWKESVFVG